MLKPMQKNPDSHGESLPRADMGMLINTEAMVGSHMALGSIIVFTSI
jgi:hypothetical protein